MNNNLNFELIEAFLSTLLYSWGGDTPSEAIWAANDFLDVLENLYNYDFILSFEELSDTSGVNNQLVIEEIRRLILQNEE